MTAQRYHLIIDLQNIPAKKITDKANLIKFLQKLPAIIGMHILFGPKVAKGIPENPGLSGFVIIDYSHISIHTFSKNNEALVDIFSCKPFKQEVALKATLDYFQTSQKSAHIKEVSWG